MRPSGRNSNAHAPFNPVATTETWGVKLLFSAGARVCPANAGLKSLPFGGRVSSVAPAAAVEAGSSAAQAAAAQASAMTVTRLRVDTCGVMTFPGDFESGEPAMD